MNLDKLFILKMALNPKKYFIKDLINKNPPVEVWLQGTIEQTVGNNILIISDESGRAKITKCELADGIIDKNSLKKGSCMIFRDFQPLQEVFMMQGMLFSGDGTYCCIIGTTIRTKGLPEVQAIKFVDLTSQPQMKLAWETEVKEANLFMEGKLIPTIK